jgi:hypothetical protein
MCESLTINSDIIKQGIIISRNYPTWQKDIDCSLVISSSNSSKSIRFYITALNIEDPNNNDE